MDVDMGGFGGFEPPNILDGGFQTLWWRVWKPPIIELLLGGLGMVICVEGNQVFLLDASQIIPCTPIGHMKPGRTE